MAPLEAYKEDFFTGPIAKTDTRRRGVAYHSSTVSCISGRRRLDTQVQQQLPSTASHRGTGAHPKINERVLRFDVDKGLHQNVRRPAGRKASN